MVKQRSAIQEGKDMMYLFTDHSGLNKFSGNDDPNFQNVRKVIEGMAMDASSTVRRNYDGISDDPQSLCYLV